MRKRIKRCHQQATKDENYRRVALSWIPTECGCGPGVLLPGEDPTCGCQQVLRRNVKDDILDVLVTGLSAEQQRDQTLMNFLAVTQLRERRRRNFRGARPQPRPVKVEKLAKVEQPHRHKRTKRSTGDHRQDYKAHYDAYIASPEWKAKRQEYIAAIRPTSCPICQGPWGKGGHIHHKSYKHMGDEPLDDLIHLCESCHDGVHRLYRRPIWHRRGLRATTDHVLAHGFPGQRSSTKQLAATVVED